MSSKSFHRQLTLSKIERAIAAHWTPSPRPRMQSLVFRRPNMTRCWRCPRIALMSLAASHRPTCALTLLLALEEPLHGAPRRLGRLARSLHAGLPKSFRALRHPAEAHPEPLRHGGCQPRGESLIQGESGIVDIPFQDEVHGDLVFLVLQGGHDEITGQAHEGVERALALLELQARDRELPGGLQTVPAHVRLQVEVERAPLNTRLVGFDEVWL